MGHTISQDTLLLVNLQNTPSDGSRGAQTPQSEGQLRSLLLGNLSKQGRDTVEQELKEGDRETLLDRTKQALLDVADKGGRNPDTNVLQMNATDPVLNFPLCVAVALTRRSCGLNINISYTHSIAP